MNRIANNLKMFGQWMGPRRTAWLIAWALSLAASCVTGRRFAPPPPIQEAPDIGRRAYGWIDDADLAETARRRNRWPLFRDTPAGQAHFGNDQNVALWRSVERVWAAYPARDGRAYPSENQGEVGCCVGCGTKHAADATAAGEIVIGNRAESWKPLCVEAIYAAGRVDVGRGEIAGDGSLGAWSAEAATRHGFAPMELIDGIDLRRFDPGRARQWGRRGAGVPEPVKAIMARHKMGAAARVTSWIECKQALAQHYAVFVCSHTGFESRKDRDGFLTPRGTWPHCMAILGYQTGEREGGLILNSWGPQAHPGPRGWGHPPEGSFWADAQTIDRMLRQGDSFALSRFEGFPARKIDWWAGEARRATWVGHRRIPSLAF
jgi:hypothetical protein